MQQTDLFNNTGMQLDPETAAMIAEMEQMAQQQQGDVIGDALSGGEPSSEEPAEGGGEWGPKLPAHGTERPQERAPQTPGRGASPDFAQPALGGPAQPTPSMPTAPSPSSAEPAGPAFAGAGASAEAAPSFSSQLRPMVGSAGGGSALGGIAGGLLGGGLSSAESGAVEEDPSSLLLSLMQMLGQGQ